MRTIKKRSRLILMTHIQLSFGCFCKIFQEIHKNTQNKKFLIDIHCEINLKESFTMKAIKDLTFTDDFMFVFRLEI